MVTPPASVSSMASADAYTHYNTQPTYNGAEARCFVSLGVKIGALTPTVLFFWCFNLSLSAIRSERRHGRSGKRYRERSRWWWRRWGQCLAAAATPGGDSAGSIHAGWPSDWLVALVLVFVDACAVIFSFFFAVVVT